MKKLLSVAILGVVLFASSNSVLAANNVSRMAVNMGGQSVAECAQSMDRGVSQCAKAPECVK